MQHMCVENLPNNSRPSTYQHHLSTRASCSIQPHKEFVCPAAFYMMGRVRHVMTMIYYPPTLKSPLPHPVPQLRRGSLKVTQWCHQWIMRLSPRSRHSCSVWDEHTEAKDTWNAYYQGWIRTTQDYSESLMSTPPHRQHYLHFKIIQNLILM